MARGEPGFGEASEVLVTLDPGFRRDDEHERRLELGIRCD
jgi:hypothetical protein